MTPPRFATDEDVQGEIATGLRDAGLDAISTPEAGRLGTEDPEQLAWATGEDRVLITFNVSDFARLHHEAMSRGGTHAGLIVLRQRPVGDVVRRVLHLTRALGPTT